MPTLTHTTADTIDLDTFYNQFPNRFGIWIHENNPNTAKPTPSSVKPTTCFIHLRSGGDKATHFFKAPTSTSIVTCICKKFHTHFISNNNDTYTSNSENLPEITAPTKNLTKKLNKTTEFIPPSPIRNQTDTRQLETHDCKKCQKPVECKFSPEENRHYLHENAIYYKDNIYHKACLSDNNTLEPLTPLPDTPKTPAKQSILTTISNFVQTPSSIFKQPELPSTITQPSSTPITQSSTSPSQQFITSTLQQTISSTTFQHSSTSSNTLSSSPSTISTPQTETQPSMMEIDSQNDTTTILTTQIIDSNSQLSHITTTQQPSDSLSLTTPNSDSTPNSNNSLPNPQLNTHSPTTQPSYATIAQQPSENTPASQPKAYTKLNPTFDWLQNFPISDNIKDNKKLQTTFSINLYDFLKKHLYNFYPGSIIKEATYNREPLKASFYHIIRKMAGERPQFLIDYIFQLHPNISKDATIPFETIEGFLKKIILRFTTILFTKLNYAEIFASPATIPPFKVENRIQFCINLARLHLYLSDNYHAINYKKFTEDFNLRPKSFTFTSHIVSTNQTGKYLTIKSDNKLNVNLLFNLPKNLFLEKYSIPSLKNSLDHFNEWFDTAFPVFSRQFSTPPNKEETKSRLQSQIRKQFISQLKTFLPTSIHFRKPYTFQDRRDECYRTINFHILTCKHENCSYVTDHKHDMNTLFKDTLNASFQEYPKETLTLEELQIDDSIFHIDGNHEATFSKPIPTILLDKLADQAEEKYCKTNSLSTSTGRRNLFFYKYLTSYQKTAAQNLGLEHLTKDSAMRKIMQNLIPTDFLARIITYYDLFLGKQPSYAQTAKYYKETAYPEAELLLTAKFNLNFLVPNEIEDSLFLKESPFQ